MSRKPSRPRISFSTSPAIDLLDRVEARLQRPSSNHGDQVADRHGAEFDERLAADADGAGLRVEPLAAGTSGQRTTRMYFSSCMRRGPAAVFLKLRQQLRDDAFPLAAVLPDAAAALLPLVGDVPVAGCRAAASRWCSCRQVVPRRLQVDAERLGDALVDVLPPAAHALAAGRRAGSRRRRSSATGRG